MPQIHFLLSFFFHFITATFEPWMSLHLLCGSKYNQSVGCTTTVFSVEEAVSLFIVWKGSADTVVSTEWLICMCTSDLFNHVTIQLQWSATGCFITVLPCWSLCWHKSSPLSTWWSLSLLLTSYPSFRSQAAYRRTSLCDIWCPIVIRDMNQCSGS